MYVSGNPILFTDPSGNFCLGGGSGPCSEDDDKPWLPTIWRCSTISSCSRGFRSTEVFVIVTILRSLKDWGIGAADFFHDILDYGKGINTIPDNASSAPPLLHSWRNGVKYHWCAYGS